MRLGIIGNGMIVRMDLPDLKKLDGVEVAAILGREQSLPKVKELCAAYQIPHAESRMERLVELGVDTVYIAVPNHLHYDYALRAMELGLNVLLEKPFASNEGESVRLRDYALSRGRFLFECVSTPYSPAYRKLEELLPQIGALRGVEARYAQHSSRYDAFCRGEIQPVFDPICSGGAMMDLNLYNLHLVVGLLGAPTGERYRAVIERGIDVRGEVTLDYPDFQAVCMAAKDHQEENGCEFRGARGILRAEGAPGVLHAVELALDGEQPQRIEIDRGAVRNASFPACVRAIAEGDWEFCQARLEQSVLVSRIMTRARLSGGVRFPADDAPTARLSGE